MLLGISHALPNEMLEERATSDGLTGLLNQRTFRQRLSAVLPRLDSRQILEHAGQALYRSKQEGRNRTTPYREPA